MKKLLLAEVAVLLVLVMVAVLVRTGVLRMPEPEPNVPDQSQTSSTPTDADTQTQPPTDPPTEPPSDAPVFNTDPPVHTLPPTEPEGPGIPAEGVVLSAKRYFVYDVERDRYLAISGSEDAPVYPASITKLFSAYVALLYLDPETVITAGDELDLVQPGSSLAYIKKGHRLTVDMLVEGMLLPSGNDAAYILAAAAARAASGQNLPASAAINYFVEMMNSTAKKVGMTGSHFRNPDGFHEVDHYTSCHDLTVIAKLALSNEVISHYTALVEDDKVVYESGEHIQWKNTNQLIDPRSDYYCYNAIGLKTGTTDAAGNCLLSAFREKDGVYIIGVFGCEERVDRFKDTRKLYWSLVCDD